MHRAVAPGGLEILPDGGDIYMVRPEVSQQLLDFRFRFAQPNHESTLGEHVRTVLPREAQHIQGLLIVRLRTYLAVQTGCCFHVVIEHVGTGVQHSCHSLGIAAEVGSEHLNAGLRECHSNLSYGFRKMRGSAVP